MRPAGYAVVALVVLVSGSEGAVAENPRFVGDGRCGNPTCHGAAQPLAGTSPENWKPWRSARTQWLNRSIDRHSRAYETLLTDEAKAIAGYMAIDATESDKCLSCHCPGGEVAPNGSFERDDGVSCEHCHGPAEHWLGAHVQKDWPEKRAGFLGFYDNRDPRVRAEKCAGCHLEIDHEIVAGGHPPLQFEMVAYGKAMKHWEEDVSEATLWGVGQLVGLRRSAEMIARRAGESDYQGLGNFPHFQDRNCYQCHHKLVDDALRQARGHYEMVAALFDSLFPEASGELLAAWESVRGASDDSAARTQARSTELAEWLAPYERRVAEMGVDADRARAILAQITAAGDRLQTVRRFSAQPRESGNTLMIDEIGLPWWHTTGAPEQGVMAVQALCDTAVPERCGANIAPELRQLLAAAKRTNYDPSAYAKALAAIDAKLFDR